MTTPTNPVSCTKWDRFDLLLDAPEGRKKGFMAVLPNRLPKT